MNDYWNIFGMILLLSFFRFQVVEGQGLNVLFQSPSIVNVTLGDTLILNVSYENNGGGGVIVFWRNSSGSIIRLAYGVVNRRDPRATIEMGSNLVIRNTALYDNGIFTFRASPDVGTELVLTFTVIIEDRGEPQIGCFGKGVTSFCECKGSGGNPPSLASWLKDGERITGPEYVRSELRQEDVVGRKQGIYTCEVQNGNLKIGKNVTLSIPGILSIEATRQSNTVKITCKANAKPAPDYKIYRIGIRLSGDDGEATHDITGSVEQYICVARNIFGNVSETTNYTANTPSTESPVTTETSSTSSPPTGIETETLSHNCDRHGTQWYLILIAVTVGIFLGMIVMYLMLRLRKRLDKKRNFSKSSNPGATQGNDSEYQELDLRQLSNKDNYQSLILGSQVPINLERQNERDPDYQGLSNVRENEENYESLKL